MPSGTNAYAEMTRRAKVAAALARRLDHPESPGEPYLSRMRRDPPNPTLARLVLGRPARGVAMSERVLRLPHHVARVRIYRPRTRGVVAPLRMVIYFHGGGFVFGNLAQGDWLCSRLARDAQACVVSVSYRLAPEHPAPAAPMDCLAATHWLMRHARRLGADASDTAVIGPSAGGNLAALVALGHRDAIRAGCALPPLTHQVLIYPVTDMALTSPSVATRPDAPILSRPIMDWYGRQYLPQGHDFSLDFTDPQVSPLYAADHTDLPPALLVAAGLDPLHDDVVRYADVLRAAGVAARVVSYPNAIHGFTALPTIGPYARLALAEVVTFLGERP